MNFPILKRKILTLTKGSIINLQVAKDKAGVKLISTVADAEAVLRVLERKRKITPPVPKQVKDRYNEAHRLWFQTNFPQSYADHGWNEPIFPKVYTSNGLTTFCINMITWSGFRATRVSSSGRKIGGKWIPGPTRSGASDISATLQGKSWMIEIKSGNDQPSDKQLAEQRREERAGGRYDFIHSASEFLQIFDSVLYGN